MGRGQDYNRRRNDLLGQCGDSYCRAGLRCRSKRCRCDQNTCCNSISRPTCRQWSGEDVNHNIRNSISAALVVVVKRNQWPALRMNIDDIDSCGRGTPFSWEYIAKVKPGMTDAEVIRSRSFSNSSLVRNDGPARKRPKIFVRSDCRIGHQENLVEV